nr:peroxisomal membrane protein 11C isoform X2 [Microcebus murinus]
MFVYTKQYGLGAEEEDAFVRWTSVLGNLADQLYYPCEHVAWAADANILHVDSFRWWTLSTTFWALSLLLGVARSLRVMLRLRQTLRSPAVAFTRYGTRGHPAAGEGYWVPHAQPGPAQAPVGGSACSDGETEACSSGDSRAGPYGHTPCREGGQFPKDRGHCHSVILGKDVGRAGSGTCPPSSPAPPPPVSGVGRTAAGTPSFGPHSLGVLSVLWVPSGRCTPAGAAHFPAGLGRAWRRA